MSICGSRSVGVSLMLLCEMQLVRARRWVQCYVRVGMRLLPCSFFSSSCFREAGV
jgi:hypothetical protein